MNFSTVNHYLMPIAFTLLLTLMLLSWSQAAFFGFSEKSESYKTPSTNMSALKGSNITSTTSKKYEILTDFVFQLSILSLTILIIIRWLESGHFPLSNLYESLLFLAWCFLSLKIVFRTENESSFSRLGLGVILSPLALLTFGFAFLSLPKEMQQSTSLVPALQSNWLMMHVTVMVLSYAALISGSILSIAFLILNRFTSEDTSTNRALQRMQPESTVALGAKDVPSYGLHEYTEEGIKQLSPKITSFNSLRLDNLSYRILALGFPLLTIGILSGAVWANEAWGSYWSWDPKETWALMTWLVFAIYLHTRITKGWSGEKPAIVASVGFCMVWFCYLGVNLLGNGLHSYGWFAN